ncbi:MAG: hypothetical protein WB507_07800 [Solirubrobacterales bacterium]
MEIHPSARKHGIADEDIEHAVENAMSIDEQADKCIPASFRPLRP